MRKMRTYSVFVVVAMLAMTAAVRADLTATPQRLAAPELKPVSNDTAEVSAEAAGQLLSNVFDGQQEYWPVVTSAAAAQTPDATAPVLTLPPGPDSATLFLLALSGVGVWQLGRTTRRLNVGFVPEWYHTGGPTQIGHATPLDLDFASAAMPICDLDGLLTIEREAPSVWWMLDIATQHFSEDHSYQAAPRGPPLYS